MKRTASFLFLLFGLFGCYSAQAQSPTKEAMNAFAHFTKTQDIKHLEAARKNIDDGYKSAKDSLSPRNNLIRAMVYSALAVVDSNRNFTYKKDPLEEASHSLKQLTSDKFTLEHEAEIEFIKNQLSRGYLNEATNALAYSNFEAAAEAFTKVDTLAPGNLHITHNLALIYEKLGYPRKAVTYYKKLIAERPEPAYYFSLSELYSLLRNEDLALEILRKGRSKFPQDKDLVFKEINHYAEKQEYTAVIELLPNAIQLDEGSIPLNFLAGFSYEVTGNMAKAEEHYEKVLNSDPNNYDANYALGLLHLNLYVKNKDKKQFMYTALNYLSKANEIDPNQLKTLQSLAILYQYSGDGIQLQRVNNRINQIKLN
jgi:tetratricopeptide (TPR) repeat protein